MCRARILLTLAVLSLPACRHELYGQKPCEFGDKNSCPQDSVCVYGTSGNTQCAKRYVGPTPLIRFPFEPSHAVACIQGTETPRGSHSSSQTLYALDLATPSDGAPAGTVFATTDGMAFVYKACEASKNDPACGNGFGNHVRILNAQGYMSFYAHLSEVLIEDAQIITIGQPIGKEGKSGDATRRHLHFSVHHRAIESWLDTIAFYRENPGALPPSIPFETTYCDPGHSAGCKRNRARMDQIPCSLPKPALLKADWRT